MSPHPDPVAEWTEGQQRVIELLTPLTNEQAAVTVPTCPSWSVKDLLAHMVGLGSDVLQGDEPDDHNPTWTQNQVDERRGEDVAAILDEWRGLTASMQAYLRDTSPRPLGDLLIHEQDLRGALDRPGARDTAGLAGVRDMLAGRLAGAVQDLPPIALVGPGWQWASSGDPADAAVVVEASDFDLVRALLARRSADQIRSWVTRGDVEPYLPAFAPFAPLPADDIRE